MTSLHTILKLLGTDGLFKLILFLLAYALVPLAEIFFFLFVGNLLGNYLVLVLAVVAGVGGAFSVLAELQRALERLKTTIRKGHYPGREYADIAGLAAAGILLITPGFITDLIGFVLLVPSVRTALGKAIVRKMDTGLREVYENLRLSALWPTA